MKTPYGKSLPRQTHPSLDGGAFYHALYRTNPRGDVMKRGIAQGTLIGLIILLVTVVVLWPILSQATVFMNNYVQGGECKASVALASFKVDKLCVLEAQSPIALNCPRRHIEVGDDATLVFEDKKTVLHDEVNDSVVETIMLEELRECWNKFGEGELAIFPEVPSQWFGTDKTGCHICSEIILNKDFEVSLQEGLNKPMQGSDESYREYLNNPNALCEDEFGTDCWTQMEEQFLGNKSVSKIDTLSQDKTYATVMVRKRFDVCEGDVKAEVSNFAYIVAHDELNNLCDVVIS